MSFALSSKRRSYAASKLMCVLDKPLLCEDATMSTAPAADKIEVSTGKMRLPQTLCDATFAHQAVPLASDCYPWRQKHHAAANRPPTLCEWERSRQAGSACMSTRALSARVCRR